MSAALLAAPLALVALGLAACVYLFVAVKRDGRRAEKRAEKKTLELQATVEELRTNLSEMSERLRDTEENAGLLVAPPPAPSGLNLSKRTQVIRLSRRGDTPGQIAATLRIPEREVELLLKVHRMVLNLPADAKTDTHPHD